MTATELLEERVLFSPNLPDEVNQLLQAGVAASHADKPKAEKAFVSAQRLDPSCLQTYFALYKFYFYQGRLQEAEREVLAAFEESARQGNFPVEYRRLVRQANQWNMYASDAALFYLYSLKALAFVKLRRERQAEAQDILTALQALDPEDRCGASVVMSLAEALDQEAA